MALIARTYTFTDGTVAYGSQVDSEVQNIVDVFNNHNSGTSAWTVVNILNDSATPLVVDNSTGSNPVAEFKVNGATKVSVSATGALTMGGSKITGLADGTAATDAATYGQLPASTLFPPIGSILAFGGTSAPTGWLLCNGASLTRTGTYADLFAAIGTAYGAADGTHFNVPDLRGRFLRGTDSGAGRDPNAGTRTAAATGGNTGDNVGSIQGQATKKNGLALTDPTHSHNKQQVGGGSFGGQVGIVNDGGTITGTASVDAASTGITLGDGDSETRPININVNYIIRY